jgi:hypothetical membrane protein
MYKQMFLNIKRLTGVCGLVGVLCILSGAIISAIGYTGRVNEPYQLKNHFVSELGEVGISKYAYVFNIMLIVGGLFVTLAMLGLSAVFNNWFSIILGVAGFVTGISAVLVGVYPMNLIEPHLKAAMTFFNMGLLSMSIFSLYIALSKVKYFPKCFVLPGTAAAISFAIFLNFPSPSDTDGNLSSEILNHISNNRPDIWPLAIMEWIVILFVLVWVLSISLYLLLDPHRSCLQNHSEVKS